MKAAARSTSRSAPRRPITCKPTGKRPAPVPQGMVIAGVRAWLNSGVKAAWSRCRAGSPPTVAGSSSSAGQATQAVVGQSSKSVLAKKRAIAPAMDRLNPCAAATLGPGVAQATGDLRRDGRVAERGVDGVALAEQIREARFLDRQDARFRRAVRPFRIGVVDVQAGTPQPGHRLIGGFADVRVEPEVQAQARAVRHAHRGHRPRRGR